MISLCVFASFPALSVSAVDSGSISVSAQKNLTVGSDTTASASIILQAADGIAATFVTIDLPDLPLIPTSSVDTDPQPIVVEGTPVDGTSASDTSLSFMADAWGENGLDVDAANQKGSINILLDCFDSSNLISYKDITITLTFDISNVSVDDIETINNNADGAYSISVTNTDAATAGEQSISFNTAADYFSFVVKEEVPEQVDVKFYRSLALIDNIQINFFVNLAPKNGAAEDAREKYSSCARTYLLCKADGKEDKEVDIDISACVKNSTALSSQAIYEGFLAVEMNKYVTATLCGADAEGNVLYKSQSFSTSVVEYCARMFSDDEESDQSKALFAYILNYGATAQKFFNNNIAEDKLITNTGDITTTAGVANIKNEVAYWLNQIQYAPELTTHREYLTDTGASIYNYLNLEDKLNLGFMILKSEVDNSAEGLSVVIKYRGTEYPIDTLAEYGGDGAAYYFAFTFDEITATRFSEPVEATFYKDGVAVSKTKQYSIESYCYDGYTDPSKTYEDDLCYSIMQYSKAARVFFGLDAQ